MIDYVLDAADIPSLDRTIVVLSPALANNETLAAHLNDRLGDRHSVADQQERANQQSDCPVHHPSFHHPNATHSPSDVSVQTPVPLLHWRASH